MAAICRQRRRFLGLAAVALFAGRAGAARAGCVFPPAGVTEFLALRDEQVIGRRRLEITRQGTEMVVRNDEELTLGPAASPRYHFLQHCEEVWRIGWLDSLVADTEEDGRLWKVRAERRDGIFGGLANGHQFSVSGYPITTTFWHRDSHSQRALLDVIDGMIKLIHGELVGEEEVPVGGAPRLCKHYLIYGQINRHLWYDLECRLVRIRAPLPDGSEVLYEVV